MSRRERPAARSSVRGSDRCRSGCSFTSPAIGYRTRTSLTALSRSVRASEASCSSALCADHSIPPSRARSRLHVRTSNTSFASRGQAVASSSPATGCAVGTEAAAYPRPCSSSSPASSSPSFFATDRTRWLYCRPRPLMVVVDDPGNCADSRSGHLVVSVEACALTGTPAGTISLIPFAVRGSAPRFAVRVSRHGFRGRIDLVASAAAVGGLGRLPFELLEDVLHRLVVADRVGNPAFVVLACDNDGAVA